MLFLKLPFAFRPGLTSSRVSRAKNKKKLPGLAKVAVVDRRGRMAGLADIARLTGVGNRVVKTDQLFQNSPSKPSNGQPSEGLLQTFFILKAITTSCFELKSKNCHWGKYEMKNLTSPNMANPFN